MRLSFGVAALLVVLPCTGFSQPTSGQAPASPDTAAITIYKDFAVVRSTIDLDLKAAITDVATTKVTRQLEPDSVVLRSLNGKPVNVLEQDYDAAVIDQNRLLRQYEGRSIDFQSLIYRSDQEGQRLVTTSGKIVRAPDNKGLQPIIEVDGKLQFQLPGMPIFPSSADSLLLKPTLRWNIGSESAAHFPAELDYITRGFSWAATYNIVAPEHSAETGLDMADLLGWVTIENTSGTEFPAANIKLMAGDVAKIEPAAGMNGRNYAQTVAVSAGRFANDEVTQKAFDDFHLYDLHRTVDLRDGETKQIEFLHASGVPVTRKYVYDGSGFTLDAWDGLNLSRDFGGQGSKKVVIVQEFKNSEANHLGIPIPAGRIRFYKQDTGGQVEFTGESTIDHTPKDATIRVVTGNAFDIIGERKQTDFHVDTAGRTMDESFEIKVKNAKEAPVKVSIIEHLYRWSNWSISSATAKYTKTDSRTIEFPVDVAASGEQTIVYTAHYSW
jgi:hypothetical protein